MILGIGVDIVDVPDLAGRLERDTFLNAFSERERTYADGLPQRRAEVLAARWAAKEAFVKALGTGLRAPHTLREIEVVHDDGGRPTIQLGPAARGLLPEGARVHCSLSHTRTCAVAYVVIERP